MTYSLLAPLRHASPRLQSSTVLNSSPVTQIPDPDKSDSGTGSGTDPRIEKNEERKKKVVVVGGGWAGFGAAKALTEAGPYDVTLLDANPNPGGASLVALYKR